MADQIDSAEGVARYLAQRQPAETLRASMSLALGANPDQEAEFRKLSAQSGVPVDAVRAFPKDVKQQATLKALDFGAIVKKFAGYGYEGWFVRGFLSSALPDYLRIT